MTPKEKFVELVKTDRKAALGQFAEAVFDSMDPVDFKVFWRQINDGSLMKGAWEPYHHMTDDQVVEWMCDTKGW